MRTLRFLAAISLPLSMALAAVTAPSSYVTALKEYLQQHDFALNGKFYMYDFNHDGSIARNDWLYIDTASGQAFRLMGKTPTQNDAFGWLQLSTLPSDLPSAPTGYFIFIDFPQDQQLYHTNAFSWVYIDRNSMGVYKLMGADQNHNFNYLDENGDGVPDPLGGVHVTIQGTNVAFDVEGGSANVGEGQSSSAQSSSQGSTWPKVTCSDEKSQQYGGMGFYYKADSWYQGLVIFNCQLDADPSWDLAVDRLDVANVKKVERYDILYDGKRADAKISTDYRAGSVHIQGHYEGRAIDCIEYYHPMAPKTLKKDDPFAIEEYMEWEGDGPCDPNFIRSTCPSWYYEDVDDCHSDADTPIEQARHSDIKENADYQVIDTQNRTHLIHIFREYKVDR